MRSMWSVDREHGCLWHCVPTAPAGRRLIIFAAMAVELPGVAGTAVFKVFDLQVGAHRIDIAGGRKGRF